MNQALSTLNSLLSRYPIEVGNLLRNTGVFVPRNSNSQQLATIIENNRTNTQMIQGLSGMVLADIKYTDDSDFSGFMKPREAVDPLSGNTLTQDTGGDATTKTGFFAKIGQGIGNLFNKNKKGGTDDGLGTDKAKEGNGVGNWFKQNSSDLLDVGKSLIGGLFNRGGDTGGNRPENTGGNFDPNRFAPTTQQPTGLSTGAKIGIGAGLVGLTVLIVVLVRRRK